MPAFSRRRTVPSRRRRVDDGEFGADPPGGAVRRAVRRARGELHHRGPRPRRRRSGEVPRHPDRHLDRGRVGAGAGRSRCARSRAAGAARPARSVGSHALTHPDARRGQRRHRAHRRAAAAPRADGRGRHRAGDARAGQRRVRRFRRARVSRGDGQGDGQAGAGRQRRPASPIPGVRRPPAHARASPGGSPTSSGCRASSNPPTWDPRSASRRRATSSSCATRSSTRSPTTSGSSSRRPSPVARSRWPCSGTPRPRRRSPARSSPATSSTATRTSTSPTAPSSSSRRPSRGPAMDEVRELGTACVRVAAV